MPNRTATPKHKAYEELTAEIVRRWTPGAAVIVDERIPGKSGRKRQIDVSVRTQLAGQELFIVFECKYYSRPVGIGKVDEFAGKLEDVGANLGVFVSDSGFDQGAIARARQHGRIQLCQLVDAASGWLRSRLSVAITVTFLDLLWPYQVSFFGVRLPSNERYLLDIKESGHAILLRDTLQRQGLDAFESFHKWGREKIEDLPLGSNTFEVLLSASSEDAVLASIKFTKQQDTFINEDLLVGASGLFNVMSQRLTLGQSTGLTLEEKAIRSIWKRHSGDLPSKQFINYRRLGWYSQESAVQVVEQILARLA